MIFFLSDCIAAGMFRFTEPDAVALLTRLTGRFSVKDPKENFAELIWTARDVGGPCVEAFGMISENSSPLGQGTPVTSSCFGIDFQMGDAWSCHWLPSYSRRAKKSCHSTLKPAPRKFPNNGCQPPPTSRHAPVSVNDVGRRRVVLMVDSAFMEIPARTE